MKRVFKGIALSIILMFSSCGVKGNPKLPPSKVPEPVNDIKIKQQGSFFVIYWRYIPRYEDGKSIKEDFSFIIEENDNRILPDLKNKANLYWFKRKIKNYSSEYCYKITVKTERNEMAESKYFCLLPVKDFPKISPELKLLPKNEGLLLIFNNKFKAVKIYKGKNKNSIIPIPVEEIQNKNHFLDRDVVPEQKYCYYITWVLKNIESNPSKIKCTIYRDSFKPKPPQNVELIKEDKKYIILWSPSPSIDTEGYIVEKNGKFVQRLSKDAYFYIIDNPIKGDIYTVYAVDKAGNKSKPVYLKIE